VTEGELAADPVDLLVIGGGVVGAGVALEAARRGLSVHLVEARDFASGTSSRSSKLVHGGLRYLREGAFGLTRESVRERGRLLHDAPGLVEPQRFLIGHYAGRSPSRRAMSVGLALYDALAGQRTREHHDAADTLRCAPGLARGGLEGASSYLDAKVDDARLVLRLLQEARAHGARTENHTRVVALLRAGDGGDGEVVGVRVVSSRRVGEDARPIEAAPVDLPARCVINATGAWADTLRRATGAAPTLRPLRGSHLLFPLWRLPVAVSVGLLHPRDGRPVFATPWEGVALVGTTDLDHAEPLDAEPAITAAEADYLLEALRAAFPSLGLTLDDALGSYAGVRPVISHGQADPSREPREHEVYVDRGLVTVTGGKLTTFRLIALDALRQAAPRLPALAELATPAGLARAQAAAILAPAEPVAPGAPGAALQRWPVAAARRLAGRHGADAESIASGPAGAAPDVVPGTDTPWAEVLWCARHEDVVHLDDLLLRRTRLGLLLRDGALADLPAWAPSLREALGWSTSRWEAEVARYRAIIERSYRVPGRALPDPTPADLSAATRRSPADSPMLLPTPGTP
jgi:glycerol-3-phosphate dehydrogenase